MSFIVLSAFLLFAFKRTLTYLHVFQQDEYDSRRFLLWIWKERAVDRKVSLAIAICALVSLTGRVSQLILGLLLTAALLAVFAFEANPMRSAKKPLALTNRAKRTGGVAFGVSVLLGLGVALIHPSLFVWIVLVQFIPVTLVLSVWFLSPAERSIQRNFWRQAHEKLLSVNPTVIGITGSYGKTSVKHILGHILETQAPSLITPGSVNTPMGISRVIREKLQSQHKYFLCEMGAYGPGSISRICDLAVPNMAVIVSIGLAHHERFKTLDTVARTKFELAESVVQRNGSVVVSEDFLAFSHSKTFINQHRESCMLVGSGAETEFRILSKGLSLKGVEAEVLWNGKMFRLSAPLFGEHHASNIAIAFAAACALGVSPDDAIVALASTPQVKHRLEVRHEPSGTLVIDDAYNSNPTGFANGLKLLDMFRQVNGRRILVTPGMVELGSAHDAEHEKIGRLAADYCDVFLAVKPERTPTMLRSFSQHSKSGSILTFPTFSGAQAWLRENLRSEDVVLLENDLPDLYERHLKL